MKESNFSEAQKAFILKQGSDGFRLRSASREIASARSARHLIWLFCTLHRHDAPNASLKWEVSAHAPPRNRQTEIPNESSGEHFGLPLTWLATVTQSHTERAETRNGCAPRARHEGARSRRRSASAYISRNLRDISSNILKLCSAGLSPCGFSSQFPKAPAGRTT
jgi:hypothetical protein